MSIADAATIIRRHRLTFNAGLLLIYPSSLRYLIHFSTEDHFFWNLLNHPLPVMEKPKLVGTEHYGLCCLRFLSARLPDLDIWQSDFRAGMNFSRMKSRLPTAKSRLQLC